VRSASDATRRSGRVRALQDVLVRRAVGRRQIAVLDHAGGVFPFPLRLGGQGGTKHQQTSKTKKADLAQGRGGIVDGHCSSVAVSLRDER